MSDKDPRLLVAEMGLRSLRNSVFTRSRMRPGLGKNEVNGLLDMMESKLMELKYSYMAPENMRMSQQLVELVDGAKQLYIGYAEAASTGMEDMARAQLMWAFGIFSGLGRRLNNPGTKPIHGIDLVAVKIRNIGKCDGGENLFTTRCIVGPRELSIVTNIKGLGSSDTLAAALLPPAVVGGTVSEAMFLGSEKIDMESGMFIPEDTVNIKEADGLLFSLLQ